MNDNFIHLAARRFSCRDYSDKPIPTTDLQYVLQSVRFAPSAVNFQPVKFFVCQSDESLEKVTKSYNRKWLQTAPVIIIACGNHNESWKRKSDNKDHCDIDVSIAIDHLTLAATQKGLATCWVCNFDVEMVKADFNLPHELEPIALIPIGYEEEKPEREIPDKKRKSIDDLFKFI